VPGVPERDSRATYHAGAIAHIVTMLREQENGWRNWFFEENINPIEVSYPVLWRNLTTIVGAVLEAVGQDPRPAPAPVLERQADQRSDEWADRYRADAQQLGLPQ
jgi:trehalose 2-sulfotransferase